VSLQLAARNGAGNIFHTCNLVVLPFRHSVGSQAGSTLCHPLMVKITAAAAAGAAAAAAVASAVLHQLSVQQCS
jgi:hypothetical protein